MSLDDRDEFEHEPTLMLQADRRFLRTVIWLVLPTCLFWFAVCKGLVALLAAK